ncbi:calcium:proton antiporter [Arenimonas sp. GDDSR-1]|uniref:calcium:proton antiporter n=1 Tax=Arenimonas sp. GDDSR-1 TaxID=2950125 RepID=UPI00261153AD|nr:calcium:proton antiporter [Arenimonas sp. GDDSR-1]
MGSSNDANSGPALGALLRREYPLLLSMLSMLLFANFGNVWLSSLYDPLWFAFMLGWLLTVILMSAFAIVRHAESLAELLGEPFGTLVLTLSIIGVEVLMISAVMLSGDGNPTMARDTMFSVVMILLGGIAGLSLLVGGLKHHEQSYNLEGARTFLALIVPLAVLGLILPNFTTSTSAGTLSAFQSIFLSAMSLGIYGIFLGVQTSRHSDYFTAPTESHRREDDLIHGHHETRSTAYHAVFLLLYILPMVLLAKKLALPLEYGTDVLGAPDVLNGFVVALLILAPEAMSAVKAALNNELQRAVNILLGSVLATIGLTIPAVLMIGLVTESTIVLGLSPVNTILLVLLLSVSTLTFSNSRTNAMLGAVHMLMFAAYLMLMFEA